VEVDSSSGVLTWTPTEAQGPDTNTITVVVSDNGGPSLSDTNSFTVIVREVNRAPVLAPLMDCTHVPGAIRWITNAASDPDEPPGQLTYTLLNAPPGMAIGPTSGVLVWGPAANCPPLTNTVVVRVTDQGSPGLTDEQSFVANLISVPCLKIVCAGAGSVALSWPAAATDAGFVLQVCTNLAPGSDWQVVSGSPTVMGDENLLSESAAGRFRAFRLASALTPLPTLQIAPTPSNAVVVSWPVAAAAAGFVLQAAPDLAPPIAWSDATNSVDANGTMNFISAPAAGTNGCYRLRLELP
jgi:hypothetical protein